MVDGASGDTTMFNEPGPTVSAAEWAALLRLYRELLAGGSADAVALCGSLPPGVPVGAYADLVREARAAGVYVLLDTSGEPLRRGLAARPDLIKPNADELAALTGFSEPARAARDARRRGARAVAASLGAEGMLTVTEEGGWQAPPPGRLAGNPTGAGDSAVAGLLSGHVEGLPWPERLARAVALSAATVVAPAAGEYDRRDLRRAAAEGAGHRDAVNRPDDGPGPGAPRRPRGRPYLVTWPCFSHTWSRLTPQLESVGVQVMESVLAPFFRST